MDKEELLDRVRARSDKVKKLEDQLQRIRAQEADLQVQRTKALEELQTAREERLKALRKADEANLPKVHIARAAGMSRPNLYVLLNKTDEPDTPVDRHESDR